MSEQKKAAIEQVIATYFDASYNGSGEGMIEVFHPAAHIYGLRDSGALIDWPIEEFAKLVAEDDPPAKSGQPREDEILAIRFTGEREAAAFVTLRIGQTRYTDVLNFIEFEGRWQVIAKMLAAAAVTAE